MTYVLISQTSAKTSAYSFDGSPQQAFEEALAQGKPVYLLFHSSTCEPCQEQVAIVQKVMPRFDNKVIYIDVLLDDPANQAFAAQMGVNYIPTSFFYDASGNRTFSYVGVLNESELTAQLEKIAGD